MSIKHTSRNVVIIICDVNLFNMFDNFIYEWIKYTFEIMVVTNGVIVALNETLISKN